MQDPARPCRLREMSGWDLNVTPGDGGLQVHTLPGDYVVDDASLGPALQFPPERMACSAEDRPTGGVLTHAGGWVRSPTGAGWAHTQEVGVGGLPWGAPSVHAGQVRALLLLASPPSPACAPLPTLPRRSQTRLVTCDRGGKTKNLAVDKRGDDASPPSSFPTSSWKPDRAGRRARTVCVNRTLKQTRLK